MEEGDKADTLYSGVGTIFLFCMQAGTGRKGFHRSETLNI
jgi:hypothetical protein